MTAAAAAIDTGFPPKVLKYGTSCANGARTSEVAASAETGMPLAIGFPMVTRSGTTPWRMNPHQASPVRPNPGCTSSAISTPPAARTTSAAGSNTEASG
ncbi:Uncharacterised protein [Mycobacteroides abscessus]|nr:Uncharacterised protein [Mycobacteroides abscessus]SKT63484.1 Uncharacterised protein [Mycobacteroides abscessus subsp. abscessus]